MYADGRYKVYIGGYNVRSKKISTYCISCDRYYCVLGKVVTEMWLDDSKSVIKSFIIPIRNIERIMDGDIKCMQVVVSFG